MSRARVLVVASAAAAVLATTPARADDPATGRVGPALGTTANGRVLHPTGQLTPLGNFPTGSALSPGGRALWAVNSGHGQNSVSVVDVRTGRVLQTLPLPGGFGGVAFSPDGRHAYVSGTPAPGNADALLPGTKGGEGDVLHVFAVDPATGLGTEEGPITLPPSTGGSGQRQSLPGVSKLYPAGVAVAPDGRHAVVALSQADKAAVVDLATRTVRTVAVGTYPEGVAFDRTGRAYVANAYDGTLSVIDPDSVAVTATITGLGGAGGDGGAQPSGMVLDPVSDRLYVAVTQRDQVAVVDTGTLTVTRTISVARPEALGVQPVAVAVDPRGRRLYVADANEDAVAVITLPGDGLGGYGADPSDWRGHHAPYTLIGKLPTAAYPTSVQVSPDGRRLLWVAGKGFGAGPNPAFVFEGDKSLSGPVETPYGSYVPDMLQGVLGRLQVPGEGRLRRLTRRALRQTEPANAAPVPAGSVVRAGGPIKHVFYVVRENRTYDQVFGSEARGDGEPRLELFDDNGVPGPTGGITPNAHALARTFPLLDHVYADSEVSVDGHIITAGSLANDYVQRGTAANYSRPGKSYDFGIWPMTFGPNAFVFDQAVKQDVSFRNYGELVAGLFPTPDARPTQATVVTNTDLSYPNNLQIGCNDPIGHPAGCGKDSGVLGSTGVVSPITSRFDVFARQFRAQAAAGAVPAFNYLILPEDHTNGTRPGAFTPQAMLADNDLALGQLVDEISHSPIWASSAIFVVEDDSQDGADHVDAHRMPAFVISPWARRGAVVHTRYDQYSVLRTAELLAGLKPLSINDALATPMTDAFDGTPDVEGTRFTAIQPQQSLVEVNPPRAALASLSRALPFDQLDMVPQAVLDGILWASAHGSASRPPRPGPHASGEEHARATGALRALAAGRDARTWLLAHTQDDEDERPAAGARAAAAEPAAAAAAAPLPRAVRAQARTEAARLLSRMAR